MGFLLCLDPLMNKRGRMYQEQINEEVSMVKINIKMHWLYLKIMKKTNTIYFLNIFRPVNPEHL
jgi:hypothetical protein